MYVRAVESKRRIIIIKKFLQRNSNHISSNLYESENENQLKSILPNDEKKFNLISNKMKDLKLKIKNATIHMYRPWEIEPDSSILIPSDNHNDDNADCLVPNLILFE